jgi:hypothetical protein
VTHFNAFLQPSFSHIYSSLSAVSGETMVRGFTVLPKLHHCVWL